MQSTRELAEQEIKALTGVIGNIPLEQLYASLLKRTEKKVEEVREDLDNDPLLNVEALLDQAPVVLSDNPLVATAQITGGGDNG